jgi:hypothetical protein
MIEMEMRVDNQVDFRRVAAERGQPRGDVLSLMVVELEQPGDALADPRRRVALAIRVHAGVEQRGALRVLDQIGRDRQSDAAFAALHQTAEIAGQMAAGESIDSEAHPAFASAKRRIAFSAS